MMYRDKAPQPPRWAEKLLERTCPPREREEVQGDLQELYACWVDLYGEPTARRRYVLNVLALLPAFGRKRKFSLFAQPLYTDMLRNYLLIAWRNLRLNKLQGTINVLGLAVGMACCGILMLFVLDEVNHDGFHAKKNQLYQVYTRFEDGNGLKAFGETSIPLAAVLRKAIPEVTNAARVDYGPAPLFRVGDKVLKASGHHVDPAFLKMFSFPLLRGNPDQVLADPNSILLTESMARRLFGNADPVGKIVQVDNQGAVTVTGILADVPENSSLQFEFLMPWQRLEVIHPWFKEQGWGNSSYVTLVELAPTAQPARVDEKLKGIYRQYAKAPAGHELEYFLHPLPKWHLYNEFKNGKVAGGNIEYIRLFSWVALGILLVACINFMNLSTARSLKRAREVGVRKVMGAPRRSLIGQFMGESLLIALLAFLLAIVLAQVTLPLFNALTQEHLRIDYANPAFWMVALSVTLLTGLIAGSYPALYLSGFQPIKVLKGVFRTNRSGVRARRVLVVTQFAFSAGLIVATLLVYKQIQFIKNRPAGYMQERLVYAWMEGDIKQNYPLIREEALKAGLVQGITLSNHAITNNYNSTTSVEWPGKQPGQQISFDVIATDFDFIETHGIQMKEGRNFSRQFTTDSTAMLLNEEAVKVMGLKHPVGARVKFWDEDRQVVGVFRSFIWGSPFQRVPPMVIVIKPDVTQVVTARLNPGKPVAEALTGLQQIVRKHNPGYPAADFQFIDSLYANKFKLETLVGKLAAMFTLLAIFVACLGLFGLAAFTAEQRTKEIGIRKVLGATILNLIALLTKDFLKITTIALLIGSLAAWYFMNDWLQKYDLRTDVSWWLFGLTGLILLLITIITVGLQAIKAAVANPVRSLRSE